MKPNRVLIREPVAQAIRDALLGCLFVVLFSAVIAQAAESLPPRPPRHFNDYAGVVPPVTADALNQQLEQFERDTSSQVLVAVFPKMQSSTSIEDYTFRVAESWQAGQKGKDNGAVLFVFIQDRKMFVQVGYGLEGAIPDALAKRIIDAEIAPRFKTGDYAGGLTAGVEAIMAAGRGEYVGTGRTAGEGSRGSRSGAGAYIPLFFLMFVVLLFFLALRSRLARGMGGWPRRRRYGHYGGWTIGGGGGHWGGGSWGGGGGGFSGGGGRFGGGGAGGSW